MNKLIRGVILRNIQKALLDSDQAKEIKHNGLNGRLKEIFLNDLIAPLLNNRYSIGTGKIVDYKGSQSKQIDICIYSNFIHAPILFASKQDFGLFPIESVLKCIEVKSNYSKNNLQSAFNTFSDLDSNLVMTSGFHDTNEYPMQHTFIKTKYDVFFFSLNNASYNPEKILNTYSKIDSQWNTEPLISNICVANKGWLCFTAKGWLHIKFDTIKYVNNEIIGYLSTVVQDLPRVEQSRGAPRIGYYLFDPVIADLFNDEKFIEHPWNEVKLEFNQTDLK